MPARGIGSSPLITKPIGGSVVYNAYTLAWRNRVILEGGSVTDSELLSVNTNITSKSWFLETDRLWVHGLQNEIAAKTSIANASTASLITTVNSPTFTSGKGFKGNGVTSYLNTNYNPSVDGIKYTLNSSSNLIYSIDDIVGDENTVLGNYNGSNQVLLFYNKAALFSGINRIYVNNNEPQLNSSVDTDTLGFYNMLRSDSSSISLYKNGVSITSGTRNSTALNNLNIYLLAFNFSGSASGFTAHKLAISGFGSGSINQSDMNTDIQALATDLGFNV